MWLEVMLADGIPQGGMSGVHTVVWGHQHGGRRRRRGPQKKRRLCEGARQKPDVTAFPEGGLISRGSCTGGGGQGKGMHPAALDLEAEEGRPGDP